MSESYSREEVETALTEEHYTILQETGGLVIYQTLSYPGDNIVLDWSRGECEWSDIEAQLEDNGIDSQAVYNRLPHRD